VEAIEVVLMLQLKLGEEVKGTCTRTDIRVKEEEPICLFHMDLELGDKEGNTTVVKVWEVEDVEAIKVLLMLHL